MTETIKAFPAHIANDDSWERLGDQIDRLVTVEMRPATGSVPAGLVGPLYNLCRAAQGAPLSTTAASILLALPHGSTVLIATGAGVSPALPAGETDGPPGAAVLAAVLRDALGLMPRFVTESDHAPAVRACANLVGFEGPAAIDLFERSSLKEARSQAAALVRDHEPAAVVFIERDGANPEGRYHGVRGNCRPLGTVAHIDELASAARESGAAVIAVGDGGNEVGFGNLRRAVNELYPDGGACLDSCATGRAANQGADAIVSASVSNWGAYGLALAIDAATASPTTFLQAPQEQQLLKACVEAGAYDGATGRATVSADGISAVASSSIIELLNEMGRIFRSQ